MGLSNPLGAADAAGRCRRDRVVGTVTCGSAYEGPPGHVHGGYVAAVFDELLGLTQSLSGKHGMTGRLTVHYRSPTPLHTELRIEGSSTAPGRKIICTGRMYAGETLCAEAEGLFITVDFGRLQAMDGRTRRVIRSLRPASLGLSRPRRARSLVSPRRARCATRGGGAPSSCWMARIDTRWQTVEAVPGGDHLPFEGIEIVEQVRMAACRLTSVVVGIRVDVDRFFARDRSRHRRRDTASPRRSATSRQRSRTTIQP